jgi:hypothetical protein
VDGGLKVGYLGAAKAAGLAGEGDVVGGDSASIGAPTCGWTFLGCPDLRAFRGAELPFELSMVADNVSYVNSGSAGEVGRFGTSGPVGRPRP